MMQTPPATSSRALAQPGTISRPMVSKPNIRPTRPAAVRTKPSESKAGGRGSRRAGMNRVTSTRPSTAIGTLIQKIQRQWK